MTNDMSALFLCRLTCSLESATILGAYMMQGECVCARVYVCMCVIWCPTHTRLPARNGLVNEVEFLGLIT